MTAAVTGAASGIGRALSVALAERGCHVAVSDIDVGGLEETASAAEGKGVRVTRHPVDVGDREQVYAYAESVVAQHEKVDIVINNAGVGVSATLEEVGYEDYEWLMGINFWGVVYGCKAFLPHLRKRPRAHLVNVSSVHGLFTNPRVGPYCSSKFAVRGFTLTLAQELRNTPVKVSCVYPGGIKTNIARNARWYQGDRPESQEEASAYFEEKLAFTTAEKAAEQIIRGIRRNRERILVGFDASLYDRAARWFPGSWQTLMGRIF
jgi:NAD(P)-dependent dehydrogenase (short-subunit alcohol dehydrogenase family)